MSKVGLEVIVSSRFKNRAALLLHVLSIAPIWYLMMPCCWASMIRPALVWTHSRHFQLLNHRFIKRLWGHCKQPAARVLCSLLSKTKQPALLSYISFHLNKIFLFMLHTNLSFPALLIQVSLILI